MINLIDEQILSAKVVGISWERIFLHMDVQVALNKPEYADKPLDFYLVNEASEAKVKFKVLQVTDGTYHLKCNIANTGEIQCIPFGTYTLFVSSGEEILAYAGAVKDVINQVDSYSRNFLYSNRQKVYTVTFFMDDSNEDMDSTALNIYLMASSQCSMDFPKFKTLSAIFGQFFKQLWAYAKNSKLMCKRLYHLYHALFYKPDKKKKTILFMSEQNETLGANLQAVLDRMKARGMDSSFELLTSARRASSENQSVASWNRLLKKMAKSDMIFVDDHAPVFDWLVLDPRTKLIQLWHAGAGFKSSGYSRWGHKGCPSPSSCHRQYAYGIAGSKNIAPFFSEVWGINDEQVLPTGMPRMDEFLDADYRRKKTEELYAQYPICKGKKVILFAPTYRGKNRKDAHYPYDLIDFERLYQVCGSDYIVLFKMHPWVHDGVPIAPQYADKFLDVGAYPNINDLFYITDLLITDYSSNIFEYSLMENPMLFFAFDKIQYSFSRGFHRAYEESAPGKVCYTFASLLKAIEEQDFEAEKVQEYIRHHFDYVDSHACDRVIDWIVLGNIPDDIQASLEQVKEENRLMHERSFLIETEPEEAREEEHAEHYDHAKQYEVAEEELPAGDEKGEENEDEAHE